MNLQTRVKEVGLTGLPDLPSEDAMIRLESASKAAQAQGRQYVGSAEGEDLQVNFRPSWTRTPKLDVLVGNGSLEDKIRDALDARKQRSQQDRVDYLSYANFQGHVLDWGVKMIITKVMDPAHLIGYQLVLTRVAEECGGARTAYYYDLLLRQKLAKELENGAASVHGFLLHLDRDILGDAKEKVESSAKIAGRLSGKGGHGSHSNPPAAKSNKASGKPDAGRSSEVAWSSIQWSGRGASSRSPRRSDKDNKQKKDGWGSKTSKSYIAWSSRRW